MHQLHDFLLIQKRNYIINGDFFIKILTKINSTDDNIKNETKSVLKRSSGARELPEKKVSSNTVKSEVIDFTNSSKKETLPNDENTEIVEIPVE